MVTLIARHREPPSQQAIQERGGGRSWRRGEIVGDGNVREGWVFLLFSASPLFPPPTHTHVGGNCPVVTDGHNFPNPPLLLANNFYTHTHQDQMGSEVLEL